MSIRVKILVVFFAIMAVIAGSLVVFSQTVLLNKFTEIENDQVARDLELVKASVEQDIENLRSTAADLTSLNTTIQFIQESSSYYLSTNFSLDDFENLNLFFSVITDDKGNILFSKTYSDGQLIDTAPDIHKHLENNGFFEIFGDGKYGIQNMDGRVVIIASYPINNPTGIDKGSGVMTLARVLNDEYLNGALVSLKTPVKVLLYDDLNNDPANSQWINNLSMDHPSYIRKVNNKVLNAYTLMPDIAGAASVVFSLEVERTIFIKGRNSIYLFIGLIVGIGWAGALIMIWLYNRIIFQPLKQLTGVANVLSTGDFSVDMMTTNKDEIGEVYRSFDHLKQFLMEISKSAQRISGGDLTVAIKPQSENDILSQSMIQMVESLKEKILVFQRGSLQVNEASAGLTHNAKDANNSTSQIANTIQQVAHGISEQTSSVNRTASAVDHLSQAIDGVTNGAERQAHAVEAASAITGQITETIHLVLENIQKVADESGKAATSAENGSLTVSETLEGMKVIKTKMDVSSGKIHQMGDRSEEIAEIVNTIEEIASQTNLLALNAAIEAARAESQANQLVEMILNKQMLIQAGLVDQLLLDNEHRPTDFWPEVARKTGMDIISIANIDGVNEFSSDLTLIGFRFSDNPLEQSYVFRQLLGKNDGIVCQPPKKRNIDSKMYKYVGISRSDGKGFIQVGFNSDSLVAFQFQVGGFAVVAGEVYRLAENARESAKTIASLIKEIRFAVSEAVKAMDESANEVENGYNLAGQSTTVLSTILSSAKEVSKQAELAATAAKKMNTFTSDLVQSVTTVSDIVEQNIAATLEMTNNSKDVSQAIENFASVSEQNSAAVEEVSASTEEMKAQADLVSNAAEDLRIMANALQDAVQSFKLESTDGDSK